jgi:hypothetical protein
MRRLLLSISLLATAPASVLAQQAVHHGRTGDRQVAIPG